MDVVSAEQARIAEEAGACAVMSLEKVPADIRKDGGVARMADPKVGVASWLQLGVWFFPLTSYSFFSPLSSPSFPRHFLLLLLSSPPSCLQRVKEIMAAVTIPVMAKCRIGHFAEAQILESLGVDFIDESEGRREVAYL